MGNLFEEAGVTDLTDEDYWGVPSPGDDTTEVVPEIGGWLVKPYLDEPSSLFAPKGCQPILEAVREIVGRMAFEVDTPEGRKQVAATARRISSTKRALDDAGKDFVAVIKAQAKPIDAERKRMRDAFDKLRDDVRKPLTDWENQQKEAGATYRNAKAAMDEDVIEFTIISRLMDVCHLNMGDAETVFKAINECKIPFVHIHR